MWSGPQVRLPAAAAAPVTQRSLLRGYHRGSHAASRRARGVVVSRGPPRNATLCAQTPTRLWP